jgi:hypothetical protein
MGAVIQRELPPELAAKVERLVDALARLAVAQDHAAAGSRPLVSQPKVAKAQTAATAQPAGSDGG